MAQTMAGKTGRNIGALLREIQVPAAAQIGVIGLEHILYAAAIGEAMSEALHVTAVPGNKNSDYQGACTGRQIPGFVVAQKAYLCRCEEKSRQ